MGHHISVRIPVPRRAGVDQFDETDSFFDQPSGRQALPSKSGGLTGLESVTIQRRLGFLAQIEDFRDGHLHPKCGFKRLKTGLEVLIGASRCQVIRIEFGQKFQF